MKKIFYPLTLLLGISSLIFFQRTWPTIDLSLLSTLSLTLVISWVFVFERVLPYRKSWNEGGDMTRDFLLTLIALPVMIRLCRWISEVSIPHSLRLEFLTPESPLLLQVIAPLLLAEFLFYWVHRFSHENKWLWKIHRLHHSVSRVYWLNSGTLSLPDLFLDFMAYSLPFSFFNLSPAAFEYGIFFSALTGLLEHANVDFKAGALNRVFNSAELHRWHHSVHAHESKTNYGKALSVWDSIFGTYFFPKKREVETVGLRE